MHSDGATTRFEMTASNRRTGRWMLSWLAVLSALLTGPGLTRADQIGQIYPCTHDCITTPRPPSNVPAPPSGAPGSPSPREVREVPPGSDVTQRDLPSGPLPRGGETRFQGDTFTVQSAREFTTYQEISARPVGEFQVATQVRGDGLAGLYVTPAPAAENQPGDLFFGMDGAGVVLQRHDGTAWRDLPRQARRLEPSVRLDVARRAGRYEFRWNGAPIGSAADAGGPMRVFLFAGPGVRAEFSRFSVVAGGSQ